MKRITATALAILMVLNLCVSAFALTLSPVVDKNSVAAGEDVTVTLSLDEAISDVTSLKVKLYFDRDTFAFKSGTSEVSGVTVNKTVRTEKDSGKPYITVNYIDMSGRGSVPAGRYATVTFTASEAIKDVSNAAFSALIASSLMVDGSSSANTKEVSVSVTVTPASTEPEGYAVAASTVNSSITVNEDAQVALKISNKDVDTYNAYYMEVSYDTSVLKYKGISTDASVTDDNGTLKIAGYGADKTCGTDNIILTFTGKATGEAKVTVTSAKVDVKANAAENNAPDATITTKTATITVGGYQVSLPDDFTADSMVAEPNKDYTFTAKNSSKKYDFADSTMGGKTVEVIDKGDGTYTVKNVSGELIIKATEKVSKVKINLTNNTNAAINGIADGQEVDPGTALPFMITPAEGKVPVVTVNGTVLEGTSIMGGQRYKYNIAADQVTGTELNIVVNYKAADKATIIESGTAWDKVGNLSRKGWTQSGDKVDAGATLDFFFKPETGKTINDYVIRANGVDCTYMKVAGRYKVTIPAEIITAGATVTINFDYAATPEPTITVGVSEYLKLDNHQSIFLITAACDKLTTGKVLAYDGNQMYWSAKYNKSNGAYAWLVISNKSLDEVKAKAEAAITAVDGAKVEIAYTGDVNLTNAADINDAQLVWNMYNAEYSDFQKVNVRKFLEADMTADGKLDTADAAAIIARITK